jgi:hypothetical protein
VSTAGTQRDGVLAGMHQKLFRQNPCTYIIKRSVNGYQILLYFIIFSNIQLGGNIYTHIDQQEQIDAINALPSFEPKKNEQ